MSFIGIGYFSKYYYYILLVFLCQLACDYFTFYNKDIADETSNDSIINYNYKIQNHFLLQNILDSLSQIFCGVIFYYYYKKTEKKKDGEMSIRQLKEIKIEYLGLKDESIDFYLFLIGIIYSANILIRTFLVSLKFDAGFWTLEIVILIFLSNRILKVRFGNHQKVTVVLVAGIGFVLQLISFFIPRTKHECGEGEDCKDIHIYDNNLFGIMNKKFHYTILVIIILIVYIIDFIMRDYCWVKAKYLMDTLTVPTFKILFHCGISGIILEIICLFFTTFFPCHTYNNIIKNNNNPFQYQENDKMIDINLSKQICNLFKYDEGNNTLKFYYANLLIFLTDYKEHPFEIFSLLAYFVMVIIINFSHFLMLKNLDSIIILSSHNFNYFFGRAIGYFIQNCKKEYMTASLFITLELLELIVIFAYLIYMEIIELKFWNLDHDLRKKITERSKSEYDISLNPELDDEKEEKETEDLNENENEKRKELMNRKESD